MCGRNSQWLGPKRRLKEFGSETGGKPRPGAQRSEHRGFFRGAKLGWRHA